MRFLVDESSWVLAGMADEERKAVLEDFVDLLDRIRGSARALTEGMEERARPVCRSRELLDTEVEPGKAVYDLLYTTSDPAWKDLLRRLGIHLDRMPDWEDRSPSDLLDVEIEGKTCFAPTVGVAWGFRARRRAVACLSLRSAGRRGPLPVTVGGDTRPVHFVVTFADFRLFFRDLIELEDVGPQEFPAVAPAAFPELEWADGVWQGLRTKKASFFGPKRSILIRHLSVLNDEGARIFHECPGGQGVDKRMSGVDVSPENGKARKYQPSIEARRATHRGVTQEFWWHTKITYDDGRIHFLHLPARPQTNDPAEGRLAIGIFNDHCILP